MKNKVISLFEDNKDIQNEGISYSGLIDRLVAPFENDFSENFYIEDIFEFAINAWNFDNMNAIVPKEEFEKVISSIPDQNTDIQLLKQMIEYKTSNFKEYNRYISDFEIQEVNGVPTLTVITESEEMHLENMMSNFAHEHTQEDFDENYINRYAFVLKPQQPFFDWINNLYPEDEALEIDKANIYLVDDGIVDLEKWLRKKFDTFFMMELNGWHTHKKDWPQKRNFKMFKQWFQVDVSDMVYDLEKRPISKEQYVI